MLSSPVLTQGAKCKEVRRFSLGENALFARDQAFMKESRKVSEFGTTYAKRGAREPKESGPHGVRDRLYEIAWIGNFPYSKVAVHRTATSF